MSMSEAKAGKPEAQYVLKFFDKAVKQALKASAALNDRNMNDEILHLIKRGQEVVRQEAQHAMQA
ncbi:MAG: hypothetical protein LBE51_13610 [Acidovorax sp.]|jgi:hypothetical protein|nr:hypothetical protein [Acidovorax sp.]